MTHAFKIILALVALVTVVRAADISITATKDIKFKPESVNVQPGDKVTWMLEDPSVPHTVVQSDQADCTASKNKSAFSSGGSLKASGFSITIPSDAMPGNLYYFCSIPGHCEGAGMKGVLVVTGSGTNSTNGTTSDNSTSNGNTTSNGNMTSNGNSTTSGTNSTSNTTSSSPSSSSTNKSNSADNLKSSFEMAFFLLASALYFNIF
ncbi:4185_t:CDS:2 [Ambispora leptoticha]|uniref:4185_t:CDS:1 n=1 Tax=Ambispora leptoticha TaxID=144679 RepID=A0A9N9CBA2_9GLOM|nr:4185_t:CDS:2 [Ambispora leptoticha]